MYIQQKNRNSTRQLLSFEFFYNLAAMSMDEVRIFSDIYDFAVERYAYLHDQIEETCLPKEEEFGV